MPQNPNNQFETSAVGYAQPPSAWDRIMDRTTRAFSVTFAVGVIAVLALVVCVIGWSSVPIIREHGLGYLTSSTWDLNGDEPQYGLLAPILGTIYSSAIALAIAGVFGVAIAIFLSQNFLPRKLEVVFKNIVELLAAIPSVVYGLWGIYVVIPLLRPLCDFLGAHFGWIPLFHGNLSGPGMLPAALVLAIMVLPTISAISYDALTSVHPRLKEGALGLGATRWETILKVIVPTASTGIFGAVVLGFGRALGETMALAMLLGNVNQAKLSLFSPGNTLAALIANNFPEADQDQVKVLLFAGVVLLAITLVVNVLGAGVIQFANRGKKGATQ